MRHANSDKCRERARGNIKADQKRESSFYQAGELSLNSDNQYIFPFERNLSSIVKNETSYLHRSKVEMQDTSSQTDKFLIDSLLNESRNKLFFDASSKPQYGYPHQMQSFPLYQFPYSSFPVGQMNQFVPFHPFIGFPKQSQFQPGVALSNSSIVNNNSIDIFLKEEKSEKKV